MAPSAPAANPTTSNTNMPFGGFGQAQADYASAGNILNNLPSQEAQTAKVNPSDTSILPSINPTYSIANAPSAQVINAGTYGTNLTGYNQAVQGAEQALTGSENNIYNQAMQQYQSNVNQFGNLPQVYQQLATQYNLPGYQQDVNTLQNLLQNLNQDVNSQTTLGGGLMTEAARDEMYSNEANPLNLALSSASRSYETGQTNVNNMLGAYETGLTNALKPEEMNISNLPELFSQTNQSAQSGYDQGATSIENTIANQQKQEEINSQNYYNSLFAKQVNQEVGQGNLASLFSGGSQSGSGQFSGVSFKNASQLGKGGYAFTVNGAPASAVSWAAANGQDPSSVIAYMAQNGDATAGQAYQALLNNPNMSLAQLAQAFPSIAWGASPAATSSPQKSSSPSKSNPGQTSFYNGLSLAL